MTETHYDVLGVVPASDKLDATEQERHSKHTKTKRGGFMITRAVAYQRCSGEGQIGGDTWDRQDEAIQTYANTHSIHIVHTFRDEGVTGKMELEGRSGLSACIEFVRENGIDLVLVESSDRLARDMIVAEVIVREFQKAGVKVVSASGGIDLTEGNDTNPTAKLIRQILAAIAEFDRCVTVLKLRGARQRKRQQAGKCEGRKAFGEASAKEAEVLSRILYLRKVSKFTCADIATDLNTFGYGTRDGGLWHRSSIAKILAREKAKESR